MGLRTGDPVMVDSFRMHGMAVALGCCLAFHVSPARADEPVGAPSSPFAAPVAESRLDALRGGEGVDNDSRVLGEVTGNSADRVVTGDNTLGGGAFAGSSGITTVIQNTGANVLIQNGMVVNVQFVDPTP